LDPEHAINKPNLQLATFKTPKIPMRIKTIRKINRPSAVVEKNESKSPKEEAVAEC
jgi:hypothetical protein